MILLIFQKFTMNYKNIKIFLFYIILFDNINKNLKNHFKLI